ncbi:hypothetical protein DXX99_07925 [Ammonifex thiophilus]|uniref:Nucleotidyltransferase family protein n=2 Tax=Ammonifex thiophilus TaxID=444093 RepID=A0A3D8P289_9THEO|nr:hypothetical protein DXX99_07925 [Ammonifex thiophilus]
MYHDEIVERSWRTLLELRKRYDFVLIGGWAAWVYTQKEKSKDIDIVVDFPELAKMRRELFPSRNGRLKRYEVNVDGFDVDIYVPYFSTTLFLPPEFVIRNAVLRGGFRVPEVEVLFLLKYGAWKERKQSLKGEKDYRDLLSLAPLVDRERLMRLVREHGKAGAPEIARDISTLLKYPGHPPKGRRPRCPKL